MLIENGIFNKLESAS